MRHRGQGESTRLMPGGHGRLGRRPPVPSSGAALVVGGQTAPATTLVALTPERGGAGGRRVVVRVAGRTLGGTLVAFDPEAPAILVREDIDGMAGVLRSVPVDSVDLISFASGGWTSPAATIAAAPAARVVAMLVRGGETLLGVTTPASVSSRGLFVTPIDAAWLDRVFVPWHAVDAVPDVRLLTEVGAAGQRVDLAALRRELGDLRAWVRAAPWQTVYAAAVGRARSPATSWAGGPEAPARWPDMAELSDPRGRVVVAALAHGMPFVTRALGSPGSSHPLKPPASDDCGAAAVALEMAAGGVVVATADPEPTGLEPGLRPAASAGWALVMAEARDIDLWRAGHGDRAEIKRGYHVC